MNVKMLMIIFSLAGMILLSGFISLGKLTYEVPDFDSAISMAEESGHPVLIVFSGSDWCRPCMIFRKTVLDSPEFQEFSKKELILLEVDFPRSKKNQLTSEQLEHNEKLAERFNPSGIFPYVMLLTAEEEILGQTEGRLFNSEDFIALLKTWMPN